jgi:hypothetical protein
MIKIIDDALNFKFRFEALNFARDSYYRIGWDDDNQQRGHSYLHSTYSEEDMVKLGIDVELQRAGILNEVTGLKRVKSVVNLSTPADSHFIHVHKGWRVILYYMNTEWQINGWHGETLFYNDDLSIRQALPYVPGRIVVFDGEIPHTIRPQSHIAPYYRFTLSMFYDTNT